MQPGSFLFAKCKAERIPNMNKEHILLSISMLISGRDEMEKSLNSLLYFKNAFPTEIILVDTGCNEEQRALAEQYADKIIKFTWCNDFGAARNAGLKEAQGEWFMYLDDDEWFDNPQEIIAFFSTDEYKSYNSASYIVRNYLDAEGKGYVDSFPSRMVKREKNTAFIGKIHEYLEPFRVPKKVFKDYAHHYGYVYADNEAMRKHMRRNTDALLKMREECPGNPRWMSQLAQEYFSINEYSKAIEVCKDGLDEWNKLKEKVSYHPVNVGALYAYILMGLERLQRYEEEKEWLNIAINAPIMKMDTMELCLSFYYMEGARLYAHLNNDKKCCEYFKKYIQDAKRFANDREKMENETVAIVTSVFHNQLLSETIMICLKSAILAKENQLAEKAFEMIGWRERKNFFRKVDAKKIVDACCSGEYRNYFETILDKMADKDQGIHEMYPIFIELQDEYKDKKEEKKVWNLRHLVSEIKCDHFYIIGTKIIWQEEKIKDREKIQTEFQELFTKCQNHILEVEDEVWDVAVKERIEIEKLFLQTDYRIWHRTLERMEHWGTCEDWDKWNFRIRNWKSREDIRYDFFDIKYVEKNLEKITEKTDDISELENQLWPYADMVYEFYQPYYREDVLQENSIGLPDELQLALELRNLRGYRKSGQERNALETMKKCLGVYPKLDKTMLVYAEMLRDEMKRQTTEAAEAQKELQQMVIYMKNLAETRIERGELDAARAILNQIQQFAPDDEEIKRLLDQIKQ